MKNQLVMPIIITVEKRDCHQHLYNEQAEPIIDIRKNDASKPIIRKLDNAVEFTEEMFAFLLSALTDADVSNFHSMYPEQLLLYRTDRLSILSLPEFVTEKNYYAAFLKEVKILKTILRLRDPSFSHDDLNPEKTNELFEILSTLEMSVISRLFFNLVSTYNCVLNNTISYLSSSDGAEAKQYNLTYKDKEVVGIVGGATDAENEYVLKCFKNEFIKEYYHDYVKQTYAYLKQMTECVKLFLNENGVIELRCPTVLSAMYMMLSISFFNHDSYKECAHKGCHNYFKVDKTHPQTRCPKHMKSRQTRRKNSYWRDVRRDPEKLKNKKKEQAYSISNAKTKFEKTKNVDDFIEFWEKLWSADGGLLSENNEDAFMLVELYIQVGRYNDAISLAKKLEKEECFRETAKYYLSILKKEIDPQ